MPITQKIKLIDKKNIAKIRLNENLKTFVVYVAALKVSRIIMHPSKVAPITNNDSVYAAVL